MFSSTSIPSAALKRGTLGGRADASAPASNCSRSVEQAHSRAGTAEQEGHAEDTGLFCRKDHHHYRGSERHP